MNAQANLREQWIHLIHKAATGTGWTRMVLTPIGVAIFGAFTVVFVFAAMLVDRLLGLPGFLPEGLRLAVSAPVIMIGAAITAWSAALFIRVKGTPVPFNPPPKLVDTGPYRYVRNPMLTGVFVFLLGIGFAINSASLVFVFMPLYILINIWELKKIEEPELEKRLGDAYVEYREKTPRFVPGLTALVNDPGRKSRSR